MSSILLRKSDRRRPTVAAPLLTRIRSAAGAVDVVNICESHSVSGTPTACSPHKRCRHHGHRLKPRGGLLGYRRPRFCRFYCCCCCCCCSFFCYSPLPGRGRARLLVSSVVPGRARIAVGGQRCYPGGTCDRAQWFPRRNTCSASSCTAQCLCPSVPDRPCSVRRSLPSGMTDKGCSWRIRTNTHAPGERRGSIDEQVGEDAVSASEQVPSSNRRNKKHYSSSLRTLPLNADLSILLSPPRDIYFLRDSHATKILHQGESERSHLHRRRATSYHAIVQLLPAIVMLKDPDIDFAQNCFLRIATVLVFLGAGFGKSRSRSIVSCINAGEDAKHPPSCSDFPPILPSLMRAKHD